MIVSTSKDDLELLPPTSLSDVNCKTNDVAIQQQNNSGDVLLTRKVARLTPLLRIGKGEGKVSKTQQLKILTASHLKEIFEEKARK